MRVVHIGANSYEVIEDGKCLFAGLKGDCESFFKEAKPKKRGRPSKKKAVIEGGDA